jgi:thioesterase domain-containing protein
MTGNATGISLHALEARWHAEIPISETMGIRVHRYDGTTLETAAALTPNVNIHGTAFAGSQFSVAALCGWGQVHLHLAAAGIEGSIVFVQGTIRCRAPVREDMLARCVWTDAAGEALEQLHSTGRARIHLDVQVESGGTIAADFSGEYGVKLL